jgi:prevent-host-death family protein
MSIIPKLTSVAAIQRNYKKVIETAKETKEPVVILKRNRPEAAIVDIDTFEKIFHKANLFDEMKALHTIEASEKEYKAGRSKKLSSLKNLLHED